MTLFFVVQLFKKKGDLLEYAVGPGLSAFLLGGHRIVLGLGVLFTFASIIWARVQFLLQRMCILMPAKG